MNGNWYCTDCEEQIDREAIDDHEGRGHHVKGYFQPDRLLPGDPEMLGSGVDTVDDAGGRGGRGGGGA